MSANRWSLSSRPVIAVVLVLLTVVAVVNVRTFGGRRSTRPGASVRVQAAPPYPLDIGDVISNASRAAARTDARGPLPALLRDPFATGVAAAAEAPPTRTATTAARPSPRKTALRCEAVFPGGRDPLAVIGGRRSRLGDRIGGRVVAEIGIAGVKLVADDGKVTFLAVENMTATPGTNGLVTSLRHVDTEGRTRLADQERNSP